MKQLTGRDNYTRYWVYRGWLSENSFSDNWWEHPQWWGLSGNTVSSSQYSIQPIQNPALVQELEAAYRPPTIDTPEIIVTDPLTSVDTAGWFWSKNKLIRIADSNDIPQMTRKIRGDAPNIGVTAPWPNTANYPQREALTTKLLSFILGDVCE
jgi:hydroxyethylthiazole kinase